MSGGTENPDLPIECGYCGFVGTADRLPCVCRNGPCAGSAVQTDCRDGSFGCPICLDGAIDPWQLIRGVRAALESYDAGPAEAVVDQQCTSRPYDVFEWEWDLLEPSILSMWTDMTTTELTPAAGDRIRFEGLLQRRYGVGTAEAHRLTEELLELYERFNDRWEAVSECVSEHWPGISSADVHGLNGTIGALAELLEGRFRLPRGMGRPEVVAFLRRIHYPLMIRLSAKRAVAVFVPTSAFEHAGRNAATVRNSGRK